MSECFHYLEGPRHFFWGMTLHLWCVLPAGALAPLQFIPSLRRRYPAAHRWLGRALLLLLIPGILSAIPLFATIQGGAVSAKSWIVGLGLAICTALWRAWRAIRASPRQVAAHRKWMLRAWAYLGAVAVIRPMYYILIWVMTEGLGLAPERALSCEHILFMFERERRDYNISAVETLAVVHPACAGGTVGVTSVVAADWLPRTAQTGRPDRNTVSFVVIWPWVIGVSVVLNALVVEWYLWRTSGNEKQPAKKQIDGVREGKKSR